MSLQPRGSGQGLSWLVSAGWSPLCSPASTLIPLHHLGPPGTLQEEFEKNKGKGFSVVADTPELQRIKKTQDQISNVRSPAPRVLP